MNNKQEIFGIHRTTLLALAVAITFGSFSVFKALEVAKNQRSEVPAIPRANHERHETHGKIAGTESASAAALSCHSGISWLPTSAASSVKTTLTAIEQDQVDERVFALSFAG